ncbi:hypothetical protein HB847_15700 [Listeria booriae]|uniref:DUF4811 domain-containing protein n=1 Tax=Listeria booriae TaxID=1552123 RepID=A0A841YA38_9LIST|nr:hypothetical protein [Listeria booriae]MBC1373796.1 hypothetical protein [Listeria booriae]
MSILFSFILVVSVVLVLFSDFTLEKMAKGILVMFVLSVAFLATIAFQVMEIKKEARHDLEASQSREWQIKEKGDLASLGTAKDNVMNGAFFLGIGQISSKQEPYYAFAKQTKRGLQVKRTDEEFRDIAFSDIYIQEKVTESPHYVLEVYTYSDKRVEDVLASPYHDEKERLTFVVPEKTVKRDFNVDAAN